MRKILILSLLFMVFNIVNVYAATCDVSVINDLTRKSNNIKVGYEIIEAKTLSNTNYETSSGVSEIINYSIKVSIYNLTNDFYVIERNDQNDKAFTIKYQNTNNGIYSFTTDDITDYVKYTYEVYTASNSCDTTLVNKINFVKPKYNYFYNFGICKDNPTVPVCAKFISKDFNIKESNLVEYVNNYLKNNNNFTTTKKVTDNDTSSFLGNYKWYIIGGSSFLVVGGIIVYIFINKKRSAL